jgi:hypothetical protein
MLVAMGELALCLRLKRVERGILIDASGAAREDATIASKIAAINKHVRCDDPAMVEAGGIWELGIRPSI